MNEELEERIAADEQLVELEAVDALDLAMGFAGGGAGVLVQWLAELGGERGAPLSRDLPDDASEGRGR